MKGKGKKLFVMIGIPLACVILAGVILWFAVIRPNQRYDAAMTLMEKEKYEDAQDAFEALNGYKDSEAKVEQCRLAIRELRYNNALALLESGHVLDACEAFRALDGYKDSAQKADAVYEKHMEKMERLKAAQVGDHLTFGAYEQDNDLTNGKEDIQWLVLDIQDGKALVVSRYALDCKAYNNIFLTISWEACSLRSWLNQVFLNTAFCVEERALIPPVTVSADPNPIYNTKTGSDTQDQVFLLSIVEANRYFASAEERKCEPTAYAVAKGAHTSTQSGLRCWWWLRSPGYLQFRASLVLNDGNIYEHGDFATYGTGTIRPAMWIDLSLAEIPE